MVEELKIKDVMVGDWVDVRNDAAPNTPHVERITPSHFLREEHWYGIELVPDILEKNGFELKPDGWIWSIEKEIEEENYIFIQFRKGCDEVRLCEINFVNKAMANFRKINYVHELQHVLRLCGIDKEIDLNK